uniref:Uncharacterized protein n=1 Tax=Chrysotila carterae TaxID=13221 RepID=A0A7S4BIQ2_CHRCT
MFQAISHSTFAGLEFCPYASSQRTFASRSLANAPTCWTTAWHARQRATAGGMITSPSSVFNSIERSSAEAGSDDSVTTSRLAMRTRQMQVQGVQGFLLNLYGFERTVKEEMLKFIQSMTRMIRLADRR